ncbi:tetratricopeptide repeat protein [Streptomyces sp. NPDC049687]|uniref:tetratricopeptide repeat protein n=1 Tax=Streptomyces sp. NPDC049687 TaxID=3365596 RepID=UPI00378F6DB5
MKRRHLLVMLTAAAAVATAVMAWAVHSHAAATPESPAARPSVNPTSQAAALVQVGLLLQGSHDSEGAVRTYQQVLRLDPRNKFAWYNLGVIAHEGGRTAEARTAYEKSLKIDPTFVSALFNEAILLKPSDPDRAMGLLERVVGIEPQAASAHLHLGEIWARKNRGREAAEEFRLAMTADPSLRSEVPAPFRNGSTT